MTPALAASPLHGKVPLAVRMTALPLAAVSDLRRRQQRPFAADAVDAFSSSADAREVAVRVVHRDLVAVDRTSPDVLGVPWRTVVGAVGGEGDGPRPCHLLGLRAGDAFQVGDGDGRGMEAPARVACAPRTIEASATRARPATMEAGRRGWWFIGQLLSRDLTAATAGGFTRILRGCDERIPACWRHRGASVLLACDTDLSPSNTP